MEKIAIFGVGLTLNDYFDMLSMKYEIKYLIDNDVSKWGKIYKGLECCSAEILTSVEVDKIVILTICERYIEEIKKQLDRMGVLDKTVHLRDLQPKVQYANVRSTLNYVDEFGNTIIVEDGASINLLGGEFLGTNNRVIIHKNVRVIDSIWFTCRGDKCLIEIGKDTSIVSVNIQAAEGGKTHIGEDCMLAHQICIMQSSCHPIINTETKKRCNRKRDITIGSHVWIGQNVALMPGFSIGNGRIVGYGAVSSSTFLNNCTIAGNPARVIRENVTWNREAVGY